MVIDAFRRASDWPQGPMNDNSEQGFLGMLSAFNHQLRSQLMCALHVLQMKLCLVSCVTCSPFHVLIFTALYGSASITQLELVRKIQTILQELYGIGQSFPPSLAMDFTRPLERVTRTGSSLFLMLFQVGPLVSLPVLHLTVGKAIILCTRPILLRRVRLEVQRQQKSLPPEPIPEILARLCDTCHEASMRSLAILYSLQQQRIIRK